jgi:predicted AlkP superfamily pyrophosphatase or phosphodiesterase
MVFVLIDALRADFMLGAATAMPFVDLMRRRNEAFAFVANAQIPTVTMPRIKVGGRRRQQ